MTRNLLALVLFSAVTSALMSAIVCGVMTYKMAGLNAAFMHIWLGGWTTAWPVAFSVILIAGPVLRKFTYRACNCPLAMPQDPNQTNLPPDLTNRTTR